MEMKGNEREFLIERIEGFFGIYPESWKGFSDKNLSDLYLFLLHEGYINAKEGEFESLMDFFSAFYWDMAK